MAELGNPQTGDQSTVSPDEQIEQEANYFAMHLLVPTDMLRAEVQKMGGVEIVDDSSGDLKKLAKRFGVSEAVIAFRLAEVAP